MTETAVYQSNLRYHSSISMQAVPSCATVPVERFCAEASYLQFTTQVVVENGLVPGELDRRSCCNAGNSEK